MLYMSKKMIHRTRIFLNLFVDSHTRYSYEKESMNQINLCVLQITQRLRILKNIIKSYYYSNHFYLCLKTELLNNDNNIFPKSLDLQILRWQNIFYSKYHFLGYLESTRLKTLCFMLRSEGTFNLWSLNSATCLTNISQSQSDVSLPSTGTF